jgi:hypothetical protein
LGREATPTGERVLRLVARAVQAGLRDVEARARPEAILIRLRLLVDPPRLSYRHTERVRAHSHHVDPLIGRSAPPLLEKSPSCVEVRKSVDG